MLGGGGMEKGKVGRGVGGGEGKGDEMIAKVDKWKKL